MIKYEMYCILKLNGIEMIVFIFGVILNFIKKKWYLVLIVFYMIWIGFFYVNEYCWFLKLYKKIVVE